MVSVGGGDATTCDDVSAVTLPSDSDPRRPGDDDEGATSAGLPPLSPAWLYLDLPGIAGKYPSWFPWHQAVGVDPGRYRRRWGHDGAAFP